MVLEPTVTKKRPWLTRHWGKLLVAAFVLAVFIDWYDATYNLGELALCKWLALVGQNAAIAICQEAPSGSRVDLSLLEYFVATTFSIFILHAAFGAKFRSFFCWVMALVGLGDIFPMCRDAPPDDSNQLALLEYLKQRDDQLSPDRREQLRRLETHFEDRAFDALTAAAGLERTPTDAKTEADTREAVRETVEEGSADERRALAKIADGDTDGGLQLLTDLASAATIETAAQWRRIGRIAYAVDTTRALNAYEKVIALDPSEAWDAIYLGRLYQRAGTLKKARRTYEDALSRLPETEQRDRSVLFNEIGNVQMAQGDLAGALESYSAAMTIAEHLAKADPDNTKWQRDLSVSHNKIGDVQKAQDDLAGALESYRAAMTITGRLSKADPDNTEWQRDLSVSHNRIGDVQKAQGDLSGALESYRAAMTIAERLTKADPNNAEWTADFAATYGKLGQLTVLMGEPDKALALFQQGRALVAPLAELSSHALWKKSLASFDAAIAALGD